MGVRCRWPGPCPRLHDGTGKCKSRRRSERARTESPKHSGRGAIRAYRCQSGPALVEDAGDSHKHDASDDGGQHGHEERRACAR